MNPVTGLLRGRYEPLEVIGEGGEGRVVRALDQQLDRQVALKIRIAPEGAVREELLREARILLSLDPHPGLPLVREDFFEGGDYVIAMDWIDGADLGRLLSERGTPGLAPTTVLRQLAQVAEALTHLHSHDPPVVHGDVKPANILLAKGGKVVLVDFGLAASGAARAQAKGTLGFVAPEVAAGATPTPASDVYSLAMTAFTLLTGSPPRGGKPEWPEGLDADRTRAFERAISLGTSADPTRRISSVGEFIEHLRAGWEADLPTGVLTSVMTDIKGSSTLWQDRPVDMSAALVRHDGILAQVVESHGGRLIKSMGEGDSSVSVFTSALDGQPARPFGPAPARRAPGQQGERGHRERVDVRRRRWCGAGCHLRGDEPERALRLCARRSRSRQPEVDQDHLPALGEEDVRRLHVAVNDGRVVGVQMRERLGDLSQMTEHRRRGQARRAPFSEKAA